MEDEPFLSVLVVNLDYKMTRVKKTIDFIESMDTPLPVIRIFGSTDKGQRICANVHGVLPYIYMRPEGMANTIFESEDKVKKFLSGVEKTLEDLLNAKRMKAASNIKPVNGEPNKPFRRRRHIHALEIVYRKTIYGMYTEPQIFVKVILRDPGDIVKIAAVLDETSLGGISMMTYESHIPYLLKFTSDYNVMPMGWLHLSQAKFRTPLPGDVPVFPPPVVASTSIPDKAVHSGDPQLAPSLAVQPYDAVLTPNSDGQLVTNAYAKVKDTTPGTPSSKTSATTPQLFLSPTVASPLIGSTIFSTTSPAAIRASGEASASVTGPTSVPSIPKQQPGYFTQSTTPWQYIWGSTPPPAAAPPTTSNPEVSSSSSVLNAETVVSEPPAATRTQSEDIAALMEGITEETFVWSQLDADGHLKPYSGGNSKTGSSSNQNGSGQAIAEEVAPDLDVRDITLLDKESCCELEVDVHISSILNSKMKKSEFGAELWEEERIRCAQLGLEMDPVTSLPSTQTVHREKQTVELLYVDRYHSLVQKGEALRKVGGELIESQSFPHNDVLLRYLSVPENQGNSQGKDSSSSKADDKASIASSTSEMQASPCAADLVPRKSHDEPTPPASRASSLNAPKSQESVDMWVSQQLKDLVENARLDEEMVQEFMSDPQSSVDAYVQSQRDEEIQQWNLSQQMLAEVQLRRSSEGIAMEESIPQLKSSASSQGQSSLRIGIADFSVTNNVDDDEEGSDWSTQCENNDILTSTQVEDGGLISAKSITLVPTGVATPVDAPEPLDMFPDSFFDETSVFSPQTSVLGITPELSRSSRPPLAPRRPSDAQTGTGPSTGSHNKPLTGRISPGYYNSASGSDSDSDASVTVVSRKKSLESNSSSEDTRSSAPSARVIRTNIGSRTPSPLLTQRSAEGISDGEGSDSSVSYESILSSSGIRRKRPRQSVRFDDEVQVIREKKRRKSVSFDHHVSVIGNSANVNGSSSTFSPLKGIAVSAAASPIKADPKPVVSIPLEELIEISSDDDRQRNQKSTKAPIEVIEISSDDDEVTIEPPTYHSPKIGVSNSGSSSSSSYGIALSDTNAKEDAKHEVDDVGAQPKETVFPGDVVHQPLYYSNPNDAKLVSLNSEAARMMLQRHPVGVKLNMDLDSLDNDLEVAIAEAKQKEEAEKLLQSQITTPTQTPFTGAAPDVLSMKVGAGANVIKRNSRLTILSCEVHCNTRATFLPNPKHDEVQAIFWVVDDLLSNSESETTKRLHGVICQMQPYAEPVKPMYRRGPAASGVMPSAEDKPFTPDTMEDRIKQQKLLLASYGLPVDTYFHVVPNEQEVFISFVNTIFNIDPDFLVGYEVQNESFGYLVKRGKIIGIDMLQAMSKMFNEKPSFRNDMTDILDGHESGLFVTGRLILNMWQRMRDELKLFNYSYSNVTANLLEMRVPYFSHSQLTRWYRNHSSRGRTIRHLHKLAELNLILIEKIDLIRKTSEMARLYGIDFFSVLSRGSQYRVEASLLVKAHAYGYVMMSPSRQKVASQAPMECIPLVMEPISQFYEDPVVVLDYQSLYPSMMIAYNLCFTTIMGKLQKGAAGVIDTTERLGASNYSEVQSAMCATLHTHAANHDNDRIDAKTPYISPNGSIFCSKQVRPGILPMMVKEMLETRQMIKRSMKKHKGKGSAVLQKVLDARQLAIKLLSNVTYGYTAAGFSGRMPMAELADAIVQSGRSILEWTHNYINSHPQWRAKVVYGDTDSVFVQLKGRTKDAAFKIGQEMSAEISAKCPGDVFLKFEKVYLPSILVTKKRYVGNMFETPSQTVPHLDAKGIEVVRRDQCPATVKMQEKCIRIMFECKDLSRVKEYCYAQWDKMLQGGDKLLLKDFIFSKEVRFGHYASVSSQPPGAIVATKAVLQDEMATPPYNWRVPYVVVHGVPNALLKHLVYSPEEVMRRGTSLRLNYTYYITKCINPALDRIMSLCGADVFAWFNAMPRPKLRLRHINYDAYHEANEAETAYKPSYNKAGMAALAPKVKKRQTLMDQFTVQGSCTVCGNDSQPQKTLCAPCSNYPLKTLVTLMSRLKLNTQKEQDMSLVCHNCSRYAQLSKLYSKGDIIGPDCCESLDCQLFFERAKLVTRIEDLYTAVNEVEDNN